MPSYDNLAGIYFDGPNDIGKASSRIPLNACHGPCSCSHNCHRRPSRPVSVVPSYSNIHDGLNLESFNSSVNLERVRRRSDISGYHPGSGTPSFSTGTGYSSFYEYDEDEVDPVATAGGPTLEMLPPEILTHILQYVLISSDSPAALYPDMTRDFARLLTTCHAFYNVGIPILYRHVSFPHPRAFDKFRHSIERTGYGNLVKVLDFSAFTSVGLGRTGKMMYEIQMVTSSTILRALELCPGLKEFLVAESVDMDIDVRVLNALDTMPYVDAVDFCGSTSSHVNGFTNSLVHSSLVTGNNAIYHLTKVSFHGCAVIKPAVFDALLPKLVNLTRLDLTHTQVTPDALLSIPASAKITHLSVAKCVRLNSTGLVNFLTLHPATKYLEWLNIMFESTKPVPLSKRDFQMVLEYLPPLKYLNLHGLPVEPKHLQHIASMPDLQGLSLGYASLTQQDLDSFLPQLTNLRYLDLTGNPYINMWTVQDSSSVLNSNPDIDIFEFSSEFIKKLWGINIPGFEMEYGKARRGWIYRKRDAVSEQSTHKEPEVTPARQGFSFSALAKDRIHRSNSLREAKNSPPPPQLSASTNTWTIESQPSWCFASRKINMCDIGIGGNMTREACKERGIYSYYAYHV
uniref:ARAD1D31372p n=1 Tax=Blastobotrys adeninivorans TaxID=409370 RepID=A0A060TB26_BLAAD